MYGTEQNDIKTIKTKKQSKKGKRSKTKHKRKSNTNRSKNHFWNQIFLYACFQPFIVKAITAKTTFYRAVHLFIHNFSIKKDLFQFKPLGEFF